MNEDTPEKILWSCVARNDTILAEAGDENFDGSVAATARGLLGRKPTPGFEFHSENSKKYSYRLKGVKFHLYDQHMGKQIIWVYAAVYDPSAVEKQEVQSFIEKIVGITEHQRESPEWIFGDTLTAQESFAPILLQRMQEVTYYGKMAMLEEKLNYSKVIMEQNIAKILENEEKLDDLREDTTKLQDMASVFKKRAKRVRRMKMMQNAKYGIMMGTAVTAGVAIVVIPPLVAIL